ncbi:MAG: anhydro-N-acetylmuramic acid kinase [Pseudomonadota bacterium]
MEKGSEARWVLGLMSGTSLDGVDAALIRTDGETVTAFGESAFMAYAREDLAAIQAVMADPEVHHGATPGSAKACVLEEAERDVTRLHARAAADLLTRSALRSGAEIQEDVLIAFPGQTVLHAPERGLTWQLGQGEALAAALGRPVVWDFRSDDVAAGGQGAPLVPFFHHALARSFASDEGPVAFLNIGGVANVTWVDPSLRDPAAEGALVAFDTGPGNALINDWMAAETGAAADIDGAAAAAGLEAARARGLSVFSTNFVEDYQRRPGPKSLDRNAFDALPARLEGWSTEAGAAALTLFTVDCVAAAVPHLPSPPSRWLICGGGRHNATMMRCLEEAFAVPVAPVEAVGLDGDMLEAQAFGHLTMRRLRGLATSSPHTTGALHAVSGGRLALPASGEGRSLRAIGR